MQDLCNIGISALGPRKKIMHALSELKKGDTGEAGDNIIEYGKKKIRVVEKEKNCGSEVIIADNTKSAANKLITDYFLGGSHSDKKTENGSAALEKVKERRGSSGKCMKQRNDARKGKHSEVPEWCCIPGTPFRVVWFSDGLHLSLLHVDFCMDVVHV